MRTTMTLIFVVLLSLGFAVTSFAVITNSAHDLRDWGTTAGLGEQRICAFCHTPHHALSNTLEPGLLWSREPSSSTYTPYAGSGSTLDSGTPTSTELLAGPSGMCMSCHDGVLAVDAYYSAAGTVAGGGTGDDNWDGYAVGLSEGLSNDHPIGFTYDQSLIEADGELNAITTPFTGNLDTTVTIASVLSGGVMTCATCHDVHNSKSIVGQAYLLYGVQEGSGICLTCHAK